MSLKFVLTLSLLAFLVIIQAQNNWQEVSGGALRIAVGPDGNPWIVDGDREIYRRVNGQWQRLPGTGIDIAVGADGTAFMVGNEAVGSNWKIYKFNGTDWQEYDGSAYRIAVDRNGSPWVANEAGDIYRRGDNRWVKVPGFARDIGAGADGSIWAITKIAYQGGYEIAWWNEPAGGGCAVIDGGAVQLSVDPQGNPWIVNDVGIIYRRSGSWKQLSGNWQPLSGTARDIGVGADGSVWIVGTAPVAGGFKIYRLVS